MPIRKLLPSVLAGYGQIFFCSKPVSGGLVLLASLLDPALGLFGLLGAVVATLWGMRGRRGVEDGLYGCNGALTGLLVGWLSWPLWLGLPVAVGCALVSAWLVDQLSLALGELPVLSLPFLLCGWALVSGPAVEGHPSLLGWLGAVVFTPHDLAGLLVGAALLWQRPYQALLAAVGGGLGLLFTDSPVVAFNAALTAVALGAVFAPSLWEGLAPAALGSGLTLLLTRASLELFGLRTLVAPFVFVVLVAQAWRLRKPCLSLPFRGWWYVSQGADGDWTHQGPWRHAWDFIVLDGQGRSFREQGERLEDYYCWGRAVFAPAGGVVVAVENSLPDNPPGQPQTEHNWGNYVILRHGSYYSELSHFRQGSVVVRPGQRVGRGQLLGECGNSGYSCEPHLHLQLQSQPVLGGHTVAAHFRPFQNQVGPAGPVPRQGSLVSQAPPRSVMTIKTLFAASLLALMLSAALSSSASPSPDPTLVVSAGRLLEITGQTPRRAYVGVSMYPVNARDAVRDGRHLVRSLKSGSFRETFSTSAYHGGTYEVALWGRKVLKKDCQLEGCQFCPRYGYHMDDMLLYRSGEIGELQ
ncbi:MAG: urea transporter [Vulcanimicrobiota bacterium]